MAAERRPGSNRGRPAIDWAAAFLFYAALSPGKRSYQAVADHFRISVRTVERHGREQSWKKKAAAIDDEAAAAARTRLKDERAAKLGDVEKLVDASLVSYAQQLRDGKVRVTPADLQRLHKLRNEIWEDPATEPGQWTGGPVAEADPYDPVDRKLAVLQALRDAGVLDQLLTATSDEHAADAGVENDKREVA